MAKSKDDHPKENLTLFVENLPIKEDKLDDDSGLYDFTNHLDQEKFESELDQNQSAGKMPGLGGRGVATGCMIDIKPPL